MATRRHINRTLATAGVATIMATGMAVCWAQQKGSPGVANTGALTATTLNAAAQAQQQQQFAMELQKAGPVQVSGSTANPRQTTGTSSPFPVASGDDPLFSLGDTARGKRNDERQKRLETDAQRLLSLANQLKGEVAASGAEAMTPEMLHQMDEIEKLAKSVKDRMRN